MAKFKVYGANAETGEDVEVIFSADTVRDAEAVASARNNFYLAAC